MKHNLRKEMKALLKAMTPDVAAAKSRAASISLIAQSEFRNARTVMIYLTIPCEVDIAEIALSAWRDEKDVVAPRVDWDQRHMIAVNIHSLHSGLTVGQFGLREPVAGQPWPVEDIDLVIVPALAYDRHGRRLGRGAGMYDRFLAAPGLRAIRCGIAFCDQVVDELPVHDYDVPVDMLVTDKEVLRFPANARPSFAKGFGPTL